MKIPIRACLFILMSFNSVSAQIASLKIPKDCKQNEFVTDLYLKKVVEASLITPTNTAVALLSNFYLHNDAEWIQTIKSSDRPVLFIGAGGTENMYKEISKEVSIKFQIIADAGHALFVDKPREFNKIVETFISNPDAYRPDDLRK